MVRAQSFNQVNYLNTAVVIPNMMSAMVDIQGGR